MPGAARRPEGVGGGLQNKKLATDENICNYKLFLHFEARRLIIPHKAPRRVFASAAFLSITAGSESAAIMTLSEASARVSS